MLLSPFGRYAMLDLNHSSRRDCVETHRNLINRLLRYSISKAVKIPHFVTMRYNSNCSSFAFVNFSVVEVAEILLYYKPTDISIRFPVI